MENENRSDKPHEHLNNKPNGPWGIEEEKAGEESARASHESGSRVSAGPGRATGEKDIQGTDKNLDKNANKNKASSEHSKTEHDSHKAKPKN